MTDTRNSENDTQNNQQKQNIRITPTLPINGCLTMVILLIFCGIAITECQRAKMRYKMDKIKYEKFMDSVNAIQADSTTFVLNKTLQLGK